MTAINTYSGGEYKVPKLRKSMFWFSTALCVLTLTPIELGIIFSDEITDIWPKIGGVIGIVFVGLVWIGMSFVFLINNDKCANCRISIKDDYRFCDKCNLKKEIEFRNTSENLHCLICDTKIESFDAFRDHYLKNHENQAIAEGICQPSFSKIRTTDTIYIKKQ